MLLGANSLREHGLVIDARIMAVYPGEDKKLPSNAIKMLRGSQFNEGTGVCLYQSQADNALYAVKPDSDELLATIPRERGDAEVYGLTPSVSVARGKGNKESTRKNGVQKFLRTQEGAVPAQEGVASTQKGVASTTLNIMRRSRRASLHRYRNRNRDTEERTTAAMA
eukprot:3581763-Pleurochrysis_carterae.AAC.1